MKRGFLNKDVSRKRNVKEPGQRPVEALPHASPQANTRGLEEIQLSLENLDLNQLIKIPETRHTFGRAPDMAKFPNLGKGMRLCTLPPGGDQAIMCLLYDGTKEALLKQPRSLSPLPYDISAFQLPYDNKEVEGKGKITFARKDLQAGEVIMCERPLMIIPGALPSAVNIRPYHEMIKPAVDHLPVTSKYLFFSLHNCKGPGVSDFAGIIDTNSINIGALPGPYKGTHAAICSAFSRINHNCQPNVKFLWHVDSLSYTVRAIRSIAKGEELFVSYLGDDFKPRAERIRQLQDKYNFICTCSCCALPKTESVRSDIRRGLLKRARDEHEELYRDQDVQLGKSLKEPDEVRNVAKGLARTLEMMDDERVYDFNTWMAHATKMCKIYCALGQREEVVTLANKASIMALTWNGKDDGWCKVARAPTSTEWWNRAEKIRSTGVE